MRAQPHRLHFDDLVDIRLVSFAHDTDRVSRWFYHAVWPRYVVTGMKSGFVTIPLVSLFVLAIGPTTWFWCIDRRRTEKSAAATT